MLPKESRLKIELVYSEHDGLFNIYKHGTDYLIDSFNKDALCKLLEHIYEGSLEVKYDNAL